MRVEVIPEFVQMGGNDAVRGFGLRWHDVPMVCDVRNLPAELGSLECARLRFGDGAFAFEHVDGAS